MPTADDCVFCGIFRREVPGSWVYEDERVAVILTIGPVTPGHAMVLPKAHVPLLADLSEEDGRHLFTVAQRTAEAIRRSGIPCEGINLFLADGEAAFQEIPHLHLHVFPRFAGDPFKLVADWDVSPARAELDENAARIRAAYDRLFGGGSSEGRS